MSPASSGRPGQAMLPREWQEANACQTLMQVHQVLVALRPGDGADSARWLNYHLRSAAIYEHIADIDRGHHHEALYWAERERRKADAIAETGSSDSVGGETGQS